MYKDTEKKENKPSSAPGSGGGFERLKRKNKRKLLRRRVFYLVLLAVLLLVFAIGIVAIFFRVSSITVEGNVAYEDSEIIEASGIEKGMNIYLIDDSSVSSRILSQFPYVRTVDVDRNIPGNIVIDMKCDSPDYYFEICGEYFVVSRDMRVMKRFTDKETLKAELPDVIKLTGGDIKTAIVGRELEFVISSYSDTAKQLLSILESTEIFSGVSSVDFSDRFNMYVVYRSRLKANIGNSDETELKLRFMNEIVKDLGEAKGTIDIKDVEAAYVLLNNDEVYD